MLLVTIGPFFTLYALLGLLTEDIRTYGNLALRHTGLGEQVFDASGPIVLAVVAVALGIRLALRVFGRRLLAWVGIFEVYLEATWILVALTGLTQVFGAVIQWFNDRQIVVWVSTARDWLSSLWEPLRLGFLGIDWLVPVVMQVVLLPLAWLIIAGIIFVRSLASVESGGSAVFDRAAAPGGAGSASSTSAPQPAHPHRRLGGHRGAHRAHWSDDRPHPGARRGYLPRRVRRALRDHPVGESRCLPVHRRP